MVDIENGPPSVALPKPKPGVLTTELWFPVVVTILNAIIASGMLPADSYWGKIVAMALAALSAMGYSVGRSMVKAAELNAAGEIRSAAIFAEVRAASRQTNKELAS